MMIRKAKQEDANKIAEIMVASWQKNCTRRGITGIGWYESFKGYR